MIDKTIMLDYCVREWVGLLAYRLAGKTHALTDQGVFRRRNGGRKAVHLGFGFTGATGKARQNGT
jgi:hypothetical protein